MYIPEFVCGVIVTILAEIIAAVTWSAFNIEKDKEKEK